MCICIEGKNRKQKTKTESSDVRAITLTILFYSLSLTLKTCALQECGRMHHASEYHSVSKKSVNTYLSIHSRCCGHVSDIVWDSPKSCEGAPTWEGLAGDEQYRTSARRLTNREADEKISLVTKPWQIRVGFQRIVETKSGRRGGG